MNLELDFRSGIPIYLQVVDRIKEMIADGRLEPGNQLPTVRALAFALRINFNTVARAYRILDESGIISTQQGRGTYIMETPQPEVSMALRREVVEALTERYLADVFRLGLDPEEILRTIDQQVKKQFPEKEEGKQ
ncbi:MAG: GntR family transcriptional regulator [Anaerolineales bacterium]|nr:GntR family transcriptional regulator [Anaerolineales bacterium]